MNAEGFLPRLVSAFIFILILSACAPTATPTLFRPPSGAITPDPGFFTPTAITTVLPPTWTPIPDTPTPIPPCTNELKWLSDLTLPDGTIVPPTQPMDKQWSVQNSGSCDWDARYRFRNVNGETLGATEEVPLYPARAGTIVTLSILFLAPSEPGTYRSEWQAVAPDGSLFGNLLYIEIVVSQ